MIRKSIKWRNDVTFPGRFDLSEDECKKLDLILKSDNLPTDIKEFTIVLNDGKEIHVDRETARLLIDDCIHTGG
jgi:hypothetical protein